VTSRVRRKLLDALLVAAILLSVALLYRRVTVDFNRPVMTWRR
jgi:hypothetical protein